MHHHAKTDSEVTSLAPSSPPRSPRRALYYVRSPSQPETPGGSPAHHRRCSSSPIHHSLESTTRFSASLKNADTWRKIGEDDEEDGEEEDQRRGPLFYSAMFVAGFVALFSIFSLVLWGASKAYSPRIAVESVVFETYNIQAGMDQSGVPTKMLSLKSTVKMSFRNPATFFGVHVSSTPLEMYYYGLKIASGHMHEFYEDRKSERVVMTTVESVQVPVYGGGSGLTSQSDGGKAAEVPVELSFVVRARANVLGSLVRSEFYRHVTCALVLREVRLGKPLRGQTLRNGCRYRD